MLLAIYKKIYAYYKEYLINVIYMIHELMLK